MDATSFRLDVAVPADESYARPMADLAAHAARYAGCHGADAAAYGAVVEAAVEACVRATARRELAIVVRRGDGPVEFLIACEQRIELRPAADRHITVAWIEEGGRQMCRVARSMPMET